MMVKVIVKIAVALGWRPDLSDPNNLRRTLPISIWRQRLFVLARVVQHNYRPYFAYLAGCPSIEAMQRITSYYIIRSRITFLSITINNCILERTSSYRNQN